VTCRDAEQLGKLRVARRHWTDEMVTVEPLRRVARDAEHLLKVLVQLGV
jgi:hypothetical protein